MTELSHITPTPEQAQQIEAMMQAKFPVTLSSIAQRLGLSDLEAARLLPTDRAAFAPLATGEAFDEFWAELATWKKVTLMILKDQHVFEIEGQLFTGKRAQGYYNILSNGATIGGHIAFENIVAAVFTSFPFMGRDSCAVQFINKEGAVSFAVYVGRENHKLVEEVVESWKSARARFAK